MKIEKQTTPDAIITELGVRVAQRRIELGMTQAEVAQQAGGPGHQRGMFRLTPGHPESSSPQAVRLAPILVAG